MSRFLALSLGLAQGSCCLQQRDVTICICICRHGTPAGTPFACEAHQAGSGAARSRRPCHVRGPPPLPWAGRQARRGNLTAWAGSRGDLTQRATAGPSRTHAECCRAGAPAHKPAGAARPAAPRSLSLLSAAALQGLSGLIGNVLNQSISGAGARSHVSASSFWPSRRGAPQPGDARAAAERHCHDTATKQMRAEKRWQTPGNRQLRRVPVGSGPFR